MKEQKSKLQCPAIKSVVILKKKQQSFKHEQKSAALKSVFGWNTTKAPPYMYHTYSAIFCFSSISQSLKHEQEKIFDAMGILKSLSKSFTQVTQIKTLIISLLAQNSYIAGCMVCANVSVALSIYICCFPVSITWAYFASLSARCTIWGPLGLSCMSFPSIRSESFTLGCRYLGSTYRQLGVHLSVCVQALTRTFYDVHLHSAEPSLGLGRPKWWRLQLQQHPACCRRAPLSNDHGSSQAKLPLYSRLYS